MYHEDIIILFLQASIFILVSWAYGFFTAQTTMWLDDAMDFGKIFDQLRFNAARRSAEKSNQLGFFDLKSQEYKQLDTFQERLMKMDELYWSIASYRKNLIPWICKVCMGTRVHIGLSILTAIFILANNAPITFGVFGIYVFSGLVSFYYIRK